VSHVPLNCRKCRIFLTTFASVTNDVQTYYHVDETKETLIASHMLDLKKENWFAK
jgi:hypothetical protein